MDILRALSTPNLDVREKILNLTLDLASQHNIEQIINVLKVPEVQQAYKNKTLLVHGWVFDITSGELIDLKIDLDLVLNGIAPIYKID